MSLPHALLGLIRYQPATGYDLKNTFNRSIHFFWNAALPHIYRTLKQMEGQGWITSTVEYQEGKPNRRVYRVTESGEEELHRWLSEPPDPPERRLPMLVKAFFGDQMPLDRLKEHLNKWRDHHVSLLQTLEEEVLPIIEKASAKPDASRDPFYWGLTLDFGRRHAQMVIEWCDQVIRDLEKVEGKKIKMD